MSEDHMGLGDQPEAADHPDSYEEGGEEGMVMMDNDSPEEYQNHWGSSLETNENPEGGEEEEEEIPFVDDLPLFANVSSKALHEETKAIEKKRDLAEKVSRQDPFP